MKNKVDPKGYLTLLKMKGGPDTIVATLGGTRYDVNEWGSCQYSSALNMFKTLEKLTKIVSKKEALEFLELKVSYERVNNIAFVSKSFYEDRKKETDEHEIFDATLKTNPLTVPGMFDYCRQASWDLWSAAPYIASKVFQKLTIKRELTISEGHYTGICCWLLYKQDFLIGLPPKKVFGGFDT